MWIFLGCGDPTRVDTISQTDYLQRVPRLLAPAKVNLRLKITGQRPDGYHLLDMVMVRVDLADEIDLEITSEGIVIESDSPEVPCDRTNTLWKMAEQVSQESGRSFGIRAFLRKRIPTAAGLGGGSSDAASLLVALNRALELNWTMERLVRVGVKVGADAPFFLTSGPQRARGIGEVLEPIKLPGLELVLINPGFPVSSADAYRWFDETSPSPSPPPLRGGGRGRVIPASALTPEMSGASLPPLENDLERAVIPRYPVLRRIKELLKEAGALGTLMSGSGPTLYGLFESRPSRDRGYELLIRDQDPRWWVWKGRTL